ncbi:MAG: hypothetical protein GXP29_06955 [Planctomycetes bacterium]|nr:hypothetical protein [Planctomycetota bacterium]
MADRFEIIAAVLALDGELASSLLLHFESVGVFVGWDDVTDAESLSAMAAEEMQCQKNVAQLLDSLDATPGPRRVQASTGAMPYTDVHALLPRLIEDKKRLVAYCREVASAVSDNSAASECISAVAYRHNEHLAALEKMAERQAS